jgi:N-acetylmuramoyl-L-alanine amidase
MATRPSLKKKLLNWVEVFPQNHQQSHLPVQVIFDFHKEMDIQKIDKEVIDETSELKLYIPDFSHEEFEKSQVKEKLSKISYIKNISFEQEKATPFRSILTLTFVQENDPLKKKNSPAHGVIVKLSTMDNRHYNARRVILELYPRDILYNLCQNHRGLKQALRDTIQPFGKNDKYVTLTHLDMYKPLTNKRIIIDAGHGGSEAGGGGFF